MRPEQGARAGASVSSKSRFSSVSRAQRVEEDGAAFAESEASAATCAPGGVAADARDKTCRIGADPSGEK